MQNTVESSSHPIHTRPAVRVLLVEDCQDLQEITAEFLKEEGLDVRTALCGREAVEIAAAFLPELVLCDLNLPDMSGLEVARGLRSIASTPPTHMVILTAMRQNELGEESAKELGVDAVLAKPITIEALEKLLQTLRPG